MANGYCLSNTSLENLAPKRVKSDSVTLCGDWGWFILNPGLGYSNNQVRSLPQVFKHPLVCPGKAESRLLAAVVGGLLANSPPPLYLHPALRIPGCLRRPQLRGSSPLVLGCHFLVVEPTSLLQRSEVFVSLEVYAIWGDLFKKRNVKIEIQNQVL